MRRLFSERTEAERQPRPSVAGTSFAASAVGTLLGSIVYMLREAEGDFAALLYAPLIALVGGFFALPAGLLVGGLCLWFGGRAIAASPIASSLGLGVLGLVLGALAGELLDMRPFKPAPYLFGSIIGSLHGILWAARSGAAKGRILASAAACATLVPGIALLAEDGWNLRESERKFEEYCHEGGSSLARVLEPEEQRLFDDRDLFKGKWYNQRRWRSLYRRSDLIDLPGGSRLIATDFAYVPQGIFAVISGGKRVARHCMSEAQTSAARFVRQHGAGRRPTLADLED